MKKIIIEIKGGMVTAVYAESDEVEIIINDLDCMAEEECESTEEMEQVY